MMEDSVVALGVTADPLTEVPGARELLAQKRRLPPCAAHHRCVTGRNARPDGIGPVLCDRDRGSVGGERIRFTSAILPRFARRTRSCGFAALYLRGVSSGDFRDGGARQGRLWLVGAGNRPAEWEAEHERWRRRDLSADATSTWWHPPGSAGANASVLIGPRRRDARNSWASRRGCESAQSWRELLACLRGRGLTIGPGRHRDGAEGAGGDLSRHPPPALLGPQDSQFEMVRTILNNAGEVDKRPPKLRMISWMEDGPAPRPRGR